MQPPRQLLAIIEDSDDDFAMYRRVLSGNGQSIYRWSTGEAAIADLRAGKPNPQEVKLFIVDLNLPGIDGCEVTRQLRELDPDAHAAICILTSSERPTDRQRALSAGADEYVVKPTDVAGLKALPATLEAVTARRS